MVGLDIGREIGTFGELRAGAYHGTGDARLTVGDPGLGDVDFNTGGTFALLRFDTADNAQFPRSGMRSDILWTGSRPSLGADRKFDTIEGEFEATVSRDKNTVQFGLSYSTTLDQGTLVQDYFPLGGFLRLSGLERGAISGPHAALGRVVYRRQVGDSTGGLFEVPAYLGASLEAGNVWQARGDIDAVSLMLNGSLFVGFDTIIGPVYLAAGFAEGGQSNWYLFIGEPPR